MDYFRKGFLDDTFFYSVHTFARVRQHYTSQNIGGTDAWAVSPPQICLGGFPPVPSRSPPLVWRCLSYIHSLLLPQAPYDGLHVEASKFPTDNRRGKQYYTLANE